MVITKIRGEPTYETLHHIKNELKSNASYIQTILGGGNHIYLGMILTSAEYHHIAPENKFTRSTNPGVLIPNPDSMSAQITSAEDTHRLTKKSI